MCLCVSTTLNVYYMHMYMYRNDQKIKNLNSEKIYLNDTIVYTVAYCHNYD